MSSWYKGRCIVSFSLYLKVSETCQIMPDQGKAATGRLRQKGQGNVDRIRQVIRLGSGCSRRSLGFSFSGGWPWMAARGNVVCRSNESPNFGEPPKVSQHRVMSRNPVTNCHSQEKNGFHMTHNSTRIHNTRENTFNRTIVKPDRRRSKKRPPKSSKVWGYQWPSKFQPIVRDPAAEDSNQLLPWAIESVNFATAFWSL